MVSLTCFVIKSVLGVAAREIFEAGATGGGTAVLLGITLPSLGFVGHPRKQYIITSCGSVLAIFR